MSHRLAVDIRPGDLVLPAEVFTYSLGCYTAFVHVVVASVLELYTKALVVLWKQESWICVVLETLICAAIVNVGPK